MDLQIRVGELHSVADMAGEIHTEADDVLSVVARGLRQICRELDGLIPFMERKAGDGNASDLRRTARRGGS